MSAASFAHVLFPGEARVLGRRLPPLTLWSLAALQSLPSPYVSADPGQRVTFYDLQIAVRLACTPVLQTPQLKPRLRDLWQAMLFRRNQRRFEAQSAIFAEWLARHQICPELWDNEEADPRTISAPLPLTQVVGLMRAGMNHREAWGTSPGYAVWLILALGERETGAVRFAREDDDVEVPDLPDSEEDIRAIAKAELSPGAYSVWLAAREKSQTASD